MQTLQTLLGQAESARDAAQAALRIAVDAAERARAQLDQLQTYRGEYQQRWQAQFSRHAAIEIVQCYRSFMDRLEQAVAQQQRVSEQVERQAEHARTRLSECELRVASVRKLIERRLHELEQRQRRIDQKRDDEAAQRAAWQRPKATDTSFH